MDDQRRKEPRPHRPFILFVAALIAAGIACTGSDSALSARIVNSANVSGDAPVKLADLAKFAVDRSSYLRLTRRQRR